MYWGLVRVGDGLLTRRELPSIFFLWNGCPSSLSPRPSHTRKVLPLKRGGGGHYIFYICRARLLILSYLRELQDNFTAEWDPEVIADTLRPYVLEHRIDTVRPPCHALQPRTTVTPSVP